MGQIDAARLLDEARRLGIEVSRNGDRLHVEGPPEAEWFVAKLAEAKPDILAAIDEPRCIVISAEPHADETDAADLDGGWHIIAAVEANGATLALTRHGIALRWTGHQSNTGMIIDRIRANRTGVAEALNKAQPLSGNVA